MRFSVPCWLRHGPCHRTLERPMSLPSGAAGRLGKRLAVFGVPCQDVPRYRDFGLAFMVFGALSIRREMAAFIEPHAGLWLRLTCLAIPGHPAIICQDPAHGSRSGGKALLSWRRVVYVLPYQVHREYEDPLFHWPSLRAWLQASQGMEWTARACVHPSFFDETGLRLGFCAAQESCLRHEVQWLQNLLPLLALGKTDLLR